jgi:hypothetical protein
MLAVDRIIEIQLVYRRDKLRCWRSSIRNTHPTVSNTLAIWIFIRMLDLMRACNILAIDCTVLKLSWITRPLMKVL